MFSIIYPCPHCRTQNFASGGRIRFAERLPLKCWKCGKEIKKIFLLKSLAGRKEEKKGKARRPLTKTRSPRKLGPF